MAAAHGLDAAAERVPAQRGDGSVEPGAGFVERSAGFAESGAGLIDPGLAERIQRDAIVRLRAGATANPGLLALVAEGRFAPPGPPWPAASPGCPAPDVPPPAEPSGGAGPDVPPPAEPSGGAGRRSAGEGTAPDRVEAVRRALAVPDLLCLVAPPGAARTLTVVEIVRAAAERGERVLITAPETAAVDAVMTRLPPGPIVVRADLPGGGPGTVAAAAAETQRRILARSQAAAHRLEPWLGEPSPAMGWLKRLTSALAEADQERQRADRACAERDTIAEETRQRLGGPVRDRWQAVEAAERAAALAGHAVERLGASLRRAEGSRFGRWRAGRLRARLAVAIPAADQAREALARARQEYAEHHDRLKKEVEQDAAVRAAADRAAFAGLAAHRALESAERSAHRVCQLLDGVAPEPAWTADVPGLSDFAEHCTGLEPMLRSRAGLLREWRQRAARPSRQLHAELLRYADVVATTCLGAGRPDHGELEFDLVVLVDAGRTALPSALVPLVRARRAVLAGDTGRGPLRDVGAALVPDEVAGLLTTSVLNRLLERAPAANRVRLRSAP
ncbi:AAA domain-containing protein [Actinoplanes missouriensis]|uniref:AAA domain-containing protein n=1 Tax=Actinoplanes missouriensis TaxID=1866 RepID=UPI00059EDB56|nr:AAA domain-containing protein [Actinoplanes missouriensis]